MSERKRLEIPKETEFKAELPPELADAPKKDQLMYLQVKSIDNKLNTCMRYAVDAYNMGVDADETIQAWKMTPTKILVATLSLVVATFVGVMTERLMAPHGEQSRQREYRFPEKQETNSYSRHE